MWKLSCGIFNKFPLDKKISINLSFIGNSKVRSPNKGYKCNTKEGKIFYFFKISPCSIFWSITKFSVIQSHECISILHFTCYCVAQANIHAWNSSFLHFLGWHHLLRKDVTSLTHIVNPIKLVNHLMILYCYKVFDSCFGLQWT